MIKKNTQNHKKYKYTNISLLFRSFVNISLTKLLKRREIFVLFMILRFFKSYIYIYIYIYIKLKNLFKAYIKKMGKTKKYTLFKAIFRYSLRNFVKLNNMKIV